MEERASENPTAKPSGNIESEAFAATEDGRQPTPDRTAEAVRPMPGPMSEPLPFQNWDRYKIVSCLGNGGMGSVYKAQDPRLKRTVAIKFLRASQLDSLDIRQRRRFEREARAQACMEHPNICKIPEGCWNSGGIA